jgi:hypothetical protein
VIGQMDCTQARLPGWPELLTEQARAFIGQAHDALQLWVNSDQHARSYVIRREKNHPQQ